MMSSIAIGLSFAAGLGFGLVFFWALKINSELYVSEGLNGIGIALHIGRFGLAVLVFWTISNFGALPLLVSFGGFLMGRFLFLKLASGENV